MGKSYKIAVIYYIIIAIVMPLIGNFTRKYNFAIAKAIIAFATTATIIVERTFFLLQCLDLVLREASALNNSVYWSCSANLMYQRCFIVYETH